MSPSRLFLVPKPKQIDLTVTPQIFAVVRRGRMTVPLRKEPDLTEFAGLPWGSTVTLRADGETLRRVVGPATRQKDQWVLPVLVQFLDDSATLADRLRRSWGLKASSSCNEK
jgi:hypothetical protein